MTSMTSAATTTPASSNYQQTTTSTTTTTTTMADVKTETRQSNGGASSWQEPKKPLRTFIISSDDENLCSDKYKANFVKEMSGKELGVGLFQREGFNNPILVLEKDGLGLRVPPPNFSVADVRAAIGSRRILDVVDVATQKTITMTMKDWHKYFESSEEEKSKKPLLNVINLEFSNTKLDSQIIAPRFVRQIDWVDKVWPRHLKEMQVESTNSVEDMMYPKVQKYCLMSVKGCYTDFHIDLGGTSAWYHILRGSKTIWLIPPTDDNLRLYQDWVLGGKKSNDFFGDRVAHCGRIEVKAGSTFFIPSGWIYAVYTGEDSIVFGGNFLHSFGIEKQLQVAFIEEVTRVPLKHRYPFFTEMLWYVLDRYISRLMGKTHLDLPEDEKRRIRLERGENIDPNKELLLKTGNNTSTEGGDENTQTPKEHIHLTQAELHGIKFIVMYLHHLSPNKKNVPVMLPDPIAVIKDIRALILEHRDDCPEKAVSSKSILRWTENDDADLSGKRQRKSIPPNGPIDRQKPGPKLGSKRTDYDSRTFSKKHQSGNRRRRVRCKVCEACQGGDCKLCVYCKDMTKYGGPGRMKQTCEKRRCLQPQLPVCAYCSYCKLDGWFNEPKIQSKETERPEEPPNLYECTVCLDIIHPSCAEKTTGLGKVNPDLSNSWECAKCVSSGFSTVPSRSHSAMKKRKSSGDDQNDDESKKTKDNEQQHQQQITPITPQ